MRWIGQCGMPGTHNKASYGQGPGLVLYEGARLRSQQDGMERFKAIFEHPGSRADIAAEVQWLWGKGGNHASTLIAPRHACPCDSNRVKSCMRTKTKHITAKSIAICNLKARMALSIVDRVEEVLVVEWPGRRLSIRGFRHILDDVFSNCRWQFTSKNIALNVVLFNNRKKMREQRNKTSSRNYW